MAEEAKEQLWPLPKFYFQVKIGEKESSFQEVSGLDLEAQVIEYRHGNSKEFSTIKMPGIKKSSNVTLKKGVFKGDHSFWDWFNKIKMNTIERQTVTISLLDESGNPAQTWTLNNAWPTKITGTDLKSDGNEVAVETMEIAHEGIIIS
ncbi:phage tail-like protein [Dysgonomonas hofstadii]|uniref:Phage tail-like protein n=1 Tax=Dysgonomonas hofstadii TaxID=637886 RepID=A0A840CXL3_9BACT|nr:phage tail protein [Dysgonomonas hofstadii]MBB4036633.1 phage tail-like protein [Dysgonomonas hofstadii]